MQSHRNRRGLMKNHTCTMSTFIFSCCVKFIFSRVALPMVREDPQRSHPLPCRATPTPHPTPHTRTHTPMPLRRRPPHSALQQLACSSYHSPLLSPTHDNILYFTALIHASSVPSSFMHVFTQAFISSLKKTLIHPRPRRPSMSVNTSASSFS